MRPVTLIEHYRPDNYDYRDPLPTREAGKGKFHAWGMDYQEFECGTGNFSTAIIEMPDGTVRNWPAYMIRFDDI